MFIAGVEISIVNILSDMHITAFNNGSMSSNMRKLFELFMQNIKLPVSFFKHKIIVPRFGTLSGTFGDGIVQLFDVSFDFCNAFTERVEIFVKKEIGGDFRGISHKDGLF
ncbi:hypothetical protein EBT31_04180 [bacterium]|nr:hypothetical protein [bacterium]